MQGKIIKGIAGFYYVHTALGVAECKARGIFRKDQITMEQRELPVVICFNKKDIASPQELAMLKEAYGGCGYQVLFVSGGMGEGTEEVRSCLAGKTTVLAGPSGVGQSTRIISLHPLATMGVGELSW